MIQNASIQSALPVLTDAALKGAFLVLIAALAAYVLRNRSAASRHAVWTAAVIGHLAIPALVFILPAWTMPVLPAAPWMQQTSSAPAIGTSTATPNPDNSKSSKASAPIAPKSGRAQPIIGREATDADAKAPAITAPSPTTVGLSRPSSVAILAAIWLIGAVLVLLRLALGTWRVGQLARDGDRVEDGVWLSLTQRLANRLGVSRPLTLLRGESLAVPITWGIVYPAVLRRIRRAWVERYPRPLDPRPSGVATS